MRGGSGETEANADTVSPWAISDAGDLMVTTVTPDGKWRSTSRKLSDEIGI